MLKKILSLVLLVAFAVLFTACASTSPESSTPQGAFGAPVPTRGPQPTLDPVDEALIPVLLPGYVPRGPVKKSWKTPEGVKYTQYGEEISQSEKYALMVPPMAALAMVDPTPTMKVALMITITGYGTAYLIENREGIAAAFVGTFVEVDKLMRKIPALTLEFPASWAPSLKHGDPIPGTKIGRESAVAIQNLIASADPISRRLTGHPDGITIVAGVNPISETDADVVIAFLHVVNTPPKPRWEYVALYGRAVRSDKLMPGWIQVPKTGWFFNPLDLAYSCAWIIASRISNGHGASPVDLWMDAGESQAWFLTMLGRFRIVAPLAYFPSLPIHPLKEFRPK